MGCDRYVVSFLLCILVIVNGLPPPMDNDKMNLKGRKSKGPPKFSVPSGNNFVTKKENACRRLSSAVKKKELAASKLDVAVQQLMKDKDKGANDAEYAESQIAILNIFSKQLNFNENIIYQTIDWLTQSLTGKFKDYRNMRISIETRLKALRDATFQEEQDYHQLLLAEKDINKTRSLNKAHEEGGVLEEILSQVAEAADQLEEGLGDNVLEDAAIAQRKQGKNGENIEALVRVSAQDEVIQRLVDANGNHFVLSKGRDSTTPIEDIVFLLDLVYIMISSSVLSCFTSLVGLPIMFGQVVCGVVLGPSALNLLTSLVQIETLAELGVFFIMFTVGLEFSPSRIKQILFISVLGSFGLMAIMMVCGVLVSLVVASSSFGESAFIAACFSLSSTPLVIKFTAGTTSPSDTEFDDSPLRSTPRREYTEILLGILVLQDVLMGILVAFLPALAGRGTIIKSAGLIVHVIIAFLVMAVISVVLVSIVQRLKAPLLQCSTEMLTLLSTGLAFTMMWVTFELGISMELGCFIAGSIISAGGDNLAHNVESLISPIKDFLSCIFFAAIGLHVFPSFVLVEIGILALATSLVVSFKFGASALVMKMSLPNQSRRYSCIIAAGLAQVSEFSFVLSSRARHLQLVSREVYLLILSISTLSLLIAPLLWKLVLVTERPTKIRTVSTSSLIAQ